MKKIATIVLLTIIMIQGFIQVSLAEKGKKDRFISVKDSNDMTKVKIGQDRLVVENRGNDVKVKVGNRGLEILESLEGKMPEVKFDRYSGHEFADCDNDDSSDNKKHSSGRHFKGHWAGCELGFNNYLTDNYSSSLPSSIEYMSIHSGKSMNFNLNFTQLSIGLLRHIGFVTGLGLNWNNYRFDGNNNIQKDPSTGDIIALPFASALKKSKLTTLYLDLPVLIEIQIPTDRQRINISAGPIGAIKLGSHTKIIYEDDKKIKSDGDFNLNLLRYGATARIGYQNFEIYGTYYKTPLFQSGKGPAGVNLFPYEIGFAFTID